MIDFDNSFTKLRKSANLDNSDVLEDAALAVPAGALVLNVASGDLLLQLNDLLIHL